MQETSNGVYLKGGIIMIKTLTDHFTGEKFRIATSGNPYLPCFGEDGIVYMWLTNLYFGGYAYKV